jgi:transposase InsO family protein
VAVYDAARLSAVQVPPDESRRATKAFLVRALRWFTARGIRVQRVMTDTGRDSVGWLVRKALRLLRIRHTRTKPHTPEINGDAERFIQMLLRVGLCNPIHLVAGENCRSSAKADPIQSAMYLNRRTPA